MATHRERMSGQVTIVNTVPDTNNDEIIRLRVALLRIISEAENSEVVCRNAAKQLSWRLSNIAKGFDNVSTHFSYIAQIAKEALHDKH